MAKFTIEIPDKKIMEAFDEASAQFNAAPTNKKMSRELKAAIQDDLENYIEGDLETFFQEGMNADLYWDFLTEDKQD